MHCPVRVAQSTDRQVRILTGRYRLTVDEFLRASLHFTEMLMPALPVRQVPVLPNVVPSTSVPDAADKPAAGASSPTPTAPSFTRDFLRAVLPACSLQAEFHRVSALIDDAVLNLRAKRVEVSAMRTASGLGLGEVRKVSTLADPTEVLWEKDRFVTTTDLEYLSRLVGRRDYMHALPVVGEMLDLNSPGVQSDAQTGLTLTLNDLDRWLPRLKYYGWVKEEVTVVTPMSADTALLIVDGFKHLLMHLTSAVCFLFAINRRLPREDFRQDLLIIHCRGKIVGSAMEEALLQSEASVHQLNGYVRLMTEKLLVFASKAKALQPIYGSEDAVPAVAEGRLANGTPRTVVTQSDIAGFKYVETELL